ncbi:MAG: hypothetical protein JXA71_14195 [Chitinispirillaceae bacterium]|nr:hypothetical protein [Chitinispirillaceae bacterium]
MKKRATTLFHHILMVIGCACIAQASDIRGVQSEFDRCISIMERCERTLRSFEDAAGRINRALHDLPATSVGKARDEAALLESRIDYYRNRYERARGLADKTRDDLNNVNGPTCPSCVESAVSLYCRSAETLQEDLDEYLQKAAELEMRLGRKKGGERPFSRPAYDTNAASLDSAIDHGRNMLASCQDKGVHALWRQVVRNREKADSLYACGETKRGVQALSISRTLLLKAEEKCAGK